MNQDENAIQFDTKDVGDFRSLRDFVQSQMAAANAPSANISLADELAKLANLRDRGILTEDEFAAQKTKLLG